jgi:hypothetical protein
MTPIYQILDEAFQTHWVGQLHNNLNAAAQLMDRHLNEVFAQSIQECEALHTFWPFPARIKVVQGSTPGEYGWGFIGSGSEEALEWIKQVRPEALALHLPSDRWVQMTLPRMSRKEILGALAQVLHANKLRDQHGEDTIGVLMKAGVFHHLEDQDKGTVALALLIDSVEVV